MQASVARRVVEKEPLKSTFKYNPPTESIWRTAKAPTSAKGADRPTGIAGAVQRKLAPLPPPDRGDYMIFVH